MQAWWPFFSQYPLNLGNKTPTVSPANPYICRESILRMEYNTSRNYLVMKEYGRHIQRMIEYIMTIEDREKRQQNAHVAIELMGFLNPHLKNVEDFRHKLWDHLFFISDFKLDVDSPYPIPTKETYKEKPAPLPYPKRHPKFSHLGKNIELVIDKALKEENPEKKNGLSNAVAYYMKLAYNNWHKEVVADEAIQAELNNLTNGQLEFTNTPYVKQFRQNDNRGNDNRNYNDFRNKRNQKFNPRGGGNNRGGNDNRNDGRNNNSGNRNMDKRGMDNRNPKFGNQKRYK